MPYQCLFRTEHIGWVFALRMCKLLCMFLMQVYPLVKLLHLPIFTVFGYIPHYRNIDEVIYPTEKTI